MTYSICVLLITTLTMTISMTTTIADDGDNDDDDEREVLSAGRRLPGEGDNLDEVVHNVRQGAVCIRLMIFGNVCLSVYIHIYIYIYICNIYNTDANVVYSL